MTTATLLFVLTTLGVKTGWQPIGDSALEYIIQIEPPALEALKSGLPITSEIPSALQGVRRYKIVVGESQPPRVGLAPQAPATAESATNVGPPQLPEALPRGERYPQPPDIQPSRDRQSPLPPPPSETVPGGSAPLPGANDATGDASADPPPPGQSAAETQAPGVYGLPASEPARPEPEKRYTSPSPRAFEADPKSTELVVEALAAAGGPADPGPAGQANTLPSNPAPDDSEETTADSGRPWIPLTVTLLGLFASMGGNIYLGWIAWDSRRHYRQLVRQSSV